VTAVATNQQTAYAVNDGKNCPAYAGPDWRNAQGAPIDVSVTCASSGLVTTAFIASGNASEYDATRRSAIKRVIATAANVDIASVSLTIPRFSIMADALVAAYKYFYGTNITAAVEITAEIIVANTAVANSIMSTLASGIFASPSALQAALASGGAPEIVVLEIVSVSNVSSHSSPPPPFEIVVPDLDDGGSPVGGITAAGVIFCILVIPGLVRSRHYQLFLFRKYFSFASSLKTTPPTERPGVALVEMPEAKHI